jgi:hypothetical protein
MVTLNMTDNTLLLWVFVHRTLVHTAVVLSLLELIDFSAHR